MKDKNILIKRILWTLLAAIISFYLFLPVINLSDPGFYMYLLFLFIVYKLTGIIKLHNFESIITNARNVPKNTLISLLIVGGTFTLIVLINLICSPLFNSKSYANRITIDDSKSFEENVSKVNFSALPLLDKASSSKLGDRVMGELPELVSQFDVSSLYTQINYNNDIVRVTPLEYADWIKYFTNRKEGVAGYITVNSVTGEAKLIKLDKGMKYMPSALFNENLYRHLRFNYVTEIFGKESFEIDNDGNPYWIVPTLKYTGVGLKKDVSGIIIVDPITGDTKKYNVDEIPTWVDQVYSADLIIEQVDDWGQYQQGYINSLFGQKGVVQTTTGYNYTVMNDDVYLYTGITSAAADESNLGFILTNLRTKETNFYSVPGAEEYSAMASAEGQVQQMKYNASFPLLINLNNRPTYLISLKDNAGLVKMYAFVDVKDYQKVVVTDSSEGIEKASQNYINNSNIQSGEVNTKSIIISSIKTASIDGTSYYYIIDTENKKYKVSIKVNNNLIPFLNVNDTINISYSIDAEVTDITKISK